MKKESFNVILYHPEIPHNTGNIVRLCANTGATLHLIEPLGFQLDDPKLKRASLDYSDLTDVLVHHSIRDCLDTLSVKQPYMVTPRTNQIYTQVAFSPGDAIMFGPESIGFKEDFLNTFDEELHISIPMAPSNRSLNLANAVSIVLYEAWRQCNFYTT
jgi:tRNA (cytidine/uridine-2'-O-)-methyltransferase|tara:strand:+ start:261 stop:734 length:474 start_codon:yes stop_codon:yes gene_type:complete